MDEKEFVHRSQKVFKEFRAVCYTDKRHWAGPWQSSYTEAYRDGDSHRYTSHGQFQFHDIRIIERVYFEARVD